MTTLTGRDARSVDGDRVPRGLPRGQAYPPLDRGHAAARLAAGAVALALALTLVGRALTGIDALHWLTDREAQASRWFVAHGSARLDSVTGVGSRIAETATCAALLLVAVLVLRWWLGRWRESLTLVVALTGELLIFLAVSALVERDRPEVRHLDAAPPTSSFPSGHTAAAVALYGCLAVIVWRQVTRRGVAVVLVGLLLLLPVAVGLSRLYRGMHHPSDVVFGALLGGLWLWLVVRTLLPNRPPHALPG